jgi:3-hydroxypropanoate dehydrogenase
MDADTAAADLAAQKAVAALKERTGPVDADTRALLFTEARTPNGWLDRPVDKATLLTLYELVKWAPTSANAQPARYVFLTSAAGKARLKPHLSEGNIEKTTTASVTVIVAHDLAFHDDLAKNFPMKDLSGRFRRDPAAAELMALRNGTIQGSFLMLAARALGLDVGAMSGFDQEGVDREFFAGTTLRSNFLCNLGYGNPAKLFRRLPRYDFDEACQII